MKRTVLFLVNHDIVIYNFRKEIVEKLLDQNYRVVISSPKGERIDNLVKMGCEFEEINISRHGKNPFVDLKLIKSYKKLISKIKPDVILSFTIKPNIYGALAARTLKVPFIANITGLGTAVEKKGLLQKITIFLYKYAFRDIQTIFFQNEENRQFFVQNNIKTTKHKLLPGSGVNLDYFKPLKYPEKETIEFAFISRIMREKGIDQYLEAAKYIRGKYPNTRFHVCGFCEENYEEKLKNYQKEDIIIYHNMVKDVRLIIKDIHCTVHPTYYPEGLSNVLLESAASARPLITTDRSGTREVVNDGINGFLIKIKDTNDLIRKIEKFIKLDFNEKEIMGVRGRQKVEKEFDRNIVVDNYLKEINIALNEVTNEL